MTGESFLLFNGWWSRNVRAFISAYPWDLLDEGLDDALDFLQGVLGATGLTLRLTSAPLVRLRSRSIEPRVIRSRGGVLFKPEEDRYRDTRCKPVASPYGRSTDAVARIAEACADRGIMLRASVQAGAIGRMAEKHPQTACKNAFDDLSHLGVCLHHPDIQAMLADLIAEVAAQPGVSGVELREAACAWYEAVHAGCLSAPPLEAGVRALLSLCFCESCFQQADRDGVDLTPVKRFVRVTLEERLAQWHHGDDLGSLIERSRPLADYLTWRTEQRDGLLQRLSRKIDVPFIVRRHRHLERLTAYRPLPVNEPYVVAPQFDTVPGGLDEPAATPPMRECGVHFTPESPDGGAALVRVVSNLVGLGAETITFDEYGVWNEAALTYVKQAIRFGRRTAT